MKVSKKYIVEVKQFLEDYYMLHYSWKATLTHRIMLQYLEAKSKYITRIGFSEATTERILNGNCILVRDEVGKVMPYRNPSRRDMNIEFLNKNQDSLYDIRLRLLNEQGYTYDEFGNVVPIEDKRKHLIGG